MKFDTLTNHLSRHPIVNQSECTARSGHMVTSRMYSPIHL